MDLSYRSGYRHYVEVRPVSADFLEIWEPQPPGNRSAPTGIASPFTVQTLLCSAVVSL